jgi:hypothetical protein
VPGDLCKLCDQALKSSDSSDDYVLQKLPLVNTFLTTGRPFGVTILALWNYSVALVALFSGLVFLAGPKALARIFQTLGFPGGDDPDFSAVGFRLLMFGLCLLISYLAYLIGTAFWRCKNWARLLTIGFSALELVFSPRHATISSRFISVIDILYLFTPHVRSVFRAVVTEERTT